MKRILEILSIIIGIVIFVVSKDPRILILPMIVFLAIIFKFDDKLKQPIWKK